MRRLLTGWPRNRRQAQSGATLVELLVSVVIMGLALTLIIGTFSTGLLDASIAKRNTAAVAVVQYELDQISGGAYNASAQPYSDCFATEDAKSPHAPATSFQGPCVGSSYTLRVDVTCNGGTCVPPNTTQLWSVTVSSWPNVGQVGSTVQIIKVNR
jgi:type II secretory pathway pseudopilin PulG